eukprot:7427247-Alexandrium_andersonii.AAC.1
MPHPSPILPFLIFPRTKGPVATYPALEDADPMGLMGGMPKTLWAEYIPIVELGGIRYAPKGSFCFYCKRTWEHAYSNYSEEELFMDPLALQAQGSRMQLPEHECILACCAIVVCAVVTC